MPASPQGEGCPSTSGSRFGAADSGSSRCLLRVPSKLAVIGSTTIPLRCRCWDALLPSFLRDFGSMPILQRQPFRPRVDHGGGQLDPTRPSLGNALECARPSISDLLPHSPSPI